MNNKIYNHIENIASLNDDQWLHIYGDLYLEAGDLDEQMAESFMEVSNEALQLETEGDE